MSYPRRYLDVKFVYPTKLETKDIDKAFLGENSSPYFLLYLDSNALPALFKLANFLSKNIDTSLFLFSSRYLPYLFSFLYS